MQQMPTLTAHKPGIVPLRPLQLGDILDGAVKAVRFNPKSMVGMSASFVWQAAWTSRVNGNSFSMPQRW